MTPRKTRDRKSRPHWYNPNTRCEFHDGIVGHPIEECKGYPGKYSRDDQQWCVDLPGRKPICERNTFVLMKIKTQESPFQTGAIMICFRHIFFQMFKFIYCFSYATFCVYQCICLCVETCLFWMFNVMNMLVLKNPFVFTQKRFFYFFML